jgi:hypothetical protein
MLFAAAAATAAVLTAPIAGAQTDSGLPQCTDTGGDAALGGTTTECATPGNVQINATPSEPTYLYPWDDEFYGPALIMGGDEGYHGGGGGGFHGGGGGAGGGGHGGR